MPGNAGCICPELKLGSLPDEFLGHVNNNDIEKIESFLSQGGDINAATEGGQTLLSASCVYKQYEVLQKLLEYPTLHLNTRHRLGTLRNFTPLCIAAYKGLTEIVSALLSFSGECHLDKNATARNGKSALILASEKGHWDTVEILCPNVLIPENDAPIISSLAKLAKKMDVFDMIIRQQGQRAETRQISDVTSPSAAEKVYENNTKPRGLVLILNYIFENYPEWKRDGTDEDVDKLQGVFENMDYEVEKHPDLSKEDTFKTVGQFSQQDRLNSVGSAVVVVLSHGKNKNEFYAGDCNKIKTNTLCSFFSDENCPQLKGKPKIFLLNFCRGEDEAEQTNFNISRSTVESENLAIESDAVRCAFTDMVCLYSAQEGFLSWRLKESSNGPFVGTPFVHSFCQVLSNKGSLWLDDLIREFIEGYRNTLAGQPMECQYLSFSKKFCFNPNE